MSRFSLFSSSPSPQETKKTDIEKDLNREIKQLVKITNDFLRIHEYYAQQATNLSRIINSLAPEEIKAYHNFYDTVASTFFDAYTDLSEVTSALNDIFRSTSLSFENKCIAAEATAVIAEKISAAILALPLQFDETDLMIIVNPVFSLQHIIEKIKEFSKQGQDLGDSKFQPFTGTIRFAG